jgi:hypothetical protein
MSSSASYISSIDSWRTEPAETPVAEHLGVDEVLVDRRQLGGQHLVEELDDLVVGAHAETFGVGGSGLTDLVENPAHRRETTAAAGAGIAVPGQLLGRGGSRRAGDLADPVVVHRTAVADHHDTNPPQS